MVYECVKIFYDCNTSFPKPWSSRSLNTRFILLRTDHETFGSKRIEERGADSRYFPVKRRRVAKGNNKKKRLENQNWSLEYTPLPLLGLELGFRLQSLCSGRGVFNPYDRHESGETIGDPLYIFCVLHRR